MSVDSWLPGLLIISLITAAAFARTMWIAYLLGLKRRFSREQ